MVAQHSMLGTGKVVQSAPLQHAAEDFAQHEQVHTLQLSENFI